MSSFTFSVTYDYRCPFARNVHEHVVTALQGGAAWDVEFAPFSLSQVHVPEGDLPVWDDPDKASHLLAMEAGIVVRDQFPEHFPEVHLALFAARHDDGRDLREERVVRDVLKASGVDDDAVLAAVSTGEPGATFRKAHDAAVAEHHVFGVPTFVMDDRAVFVRIMTRPGGDVALATATIEHILQLVVDRPELNEFKHTSIAR